jgi:hypothetical protein
LKFVIELGLGHKSCRTRRDSEETNKDFDIGVIFKELHAMKKKSSAFETKNDRNGWDDIVIVKKDED